MKIFVLNTGLFDEDAIVAEAIASLELQHEIERFDATRSDLEDADWDSAVSHLIAADRAVTI